MSEEVGFDAVVGLALRVGDLTSSLDAEQRRRKEHERSMIPVDAPLAAAGTFPAAGNLALDLGYPPQGKVWLLRRVVVGGSNWSSAVAGSAELYASSMVAPALAVDRPLSQLADQANQLPNVAFYAGRQVVLTAPTRLAVVIIGGTTGDIYQAGAWIEQYDLAAYREVYEL